MASQRQRNNKINGLEDANRVWQEGDKVIQDIISNYFSSIYRSDQPSHFSLVIDAVETKVTAEINDSLLQAFQPEEIQAALQQMHPIKSPGPNGMPPIFFQKYWNIVGQNFSDCILNILNTGMMPLEMNTKLTFA